MPNSFSNKPGFYDEDDKTNRTNEQQTNDPKQNNDKSIDEKNKKSNINESKGLVQEDYLDCIVLFDIDFNYSSFHLNEISLEAVGLADFSINSH